MWECKESIEMTPRYSLPAISKPPLPKKDTKEPDTIVQRQEAQAQQLIQVPPLYQHSWQVHFISGQHKLKCASMVKKWIDVTFHSNVGSDSAKQLYSPSAHKRTMAAAAGGTDENQDESSQMKMSERNAEK